MATVSQSRLNERWIRIPTDRLAIERGYYFDEDAADRVCDFFPKYLRHSSGRFAGKPFILDDWQRDCVSRAYGWKRPNGFRRFSEVYLEVPKKNGKSSLLAGLALYGLCEERGSEVYTGAVNKLQAQIIYREAERMVRKSPKLRQVLKITSSLRRIQFPKIDGLFESLSADIESKDGINMTHGILDEIHRFKKSALYDILLYAGTSREQSILWMLSTAGDSPYSLWGQMRDRSERILSGEDPDLHFLPIVYAADRFKDDLDDPEVWKRVNPSMGKIFSIEKFAEEYEQAKKTQRKLTQFLRLRLGVPETQASAWINMKHWHSCRRVYDLSFFVGKVCFGAIDVSSVRDLTSFAICTQIDREVYFYVITYMPKDVIEERAERDRVPYSRWAEEGWLVETPGNTTDYQAIEKTVDDVTDLGITLYSIGLDPWNARQMMQNLANKGYDIVEVRQTFASLTSATKRFEKLIADGDLRHDGNPVFAWCVSNVVTIEDLNGNLRPSKSESKKRIDCAVAAIMALGLCEENPDVGPPSITTF
jgi:phage terminase large subunit-like protein